MLKIKPEEWVIKNLPELDDFAAELAKKLEPPLLVKVSGEPGAGKTTLIAALLRQWGIAEANSPSFNLRHDFRAGNFRIIHLDFYRLKPNDLLWDILPPEEDYSDAIVFAEWPEKVPDQVFGLFPRQFVLKVGVSDGGTRQISINMA